MIFVTLAPLDPSLSSFMTRYWCHFKVPHVLRQVGKHNRPPLGPSPVIDDVTVTSCPAWSGSGKNVTGHFLRWMVYPVHCRPGNNGSDVRFGNWGLGLLCASRGEV
ncbi:hypothetical protein TNCT_641731 [Trichonephila clavata]|uniref:Uncharacterized protein n=1 Tax=Trichonephila clavata TaxID=2740835 RepID=A0A8X6KLN7_TRICU|nr:hypothetical protein TNCT_641731 [Trichonephila clavata]